MVIELVMILALFPECVLELELMRRFALSSSPFYPFLLIDSLAPCTTTRPSPSTSTPTPNQPTARPK
jgi:hypothetical protein